MVQVNKEHNLTDEQYNLLLAFITEKNIYDPTLQSELAELMIQKMDLSRHYETASEFQLAIKNAYQQFPITGFTKWVDRNRKLSDRKAFKILIKGIFSYFTIPNLIYTGIFFLISYLALRLWGDYAIKGFGLLEIIIGGYALYVEGKFFKKHKERIEKGTLKNIYPFPISGVCISVGLTIIIMGYSNSQLNLPQGMILILSALMTFFWIMYHLVIIKNPFKEVNT